jgi:hypothetical protein
MGVSLMGTIQSFIHGHPDASLYFVMSGGTIKSFLEDLAVL